MKKIKKEVIVMMFAASAVICLNTTSNAFKLYASNSSFGLGEVSAAKS
jgi:hypothetical protein